MSSTTLTTCSMSLQPQLQTGPQARLAARSESHAKPTSGLAPGHLQANLIVLPSRYAQDFRDLCARNPVPCPLLAESSEPGDFSSLKSHLPGIPGSAIAADLDLRTDCPGYHVYRDSKLVLDTVPDIKDQWTSDHIGFLVGCSFSFESALSKAGLPPRHAVLDRNVSIYRTSIPLNPAGVFTGATHIVSMRPYPKAAIEKVRAITRPYLQTHGECIAWGWDAVEKLGINDIDVPEWGDAPLTMEGEPLGRNWGDEDNVPVFWACGVTPQEAVMKSGLKGTVMAHAPGYMLVLDCLETDVIC
ncbi:hypothetical protein NLU13_8761 [Sarocladium strictum]|uniref:Uncharacterized protein n=1 Tax=Sarocladium strictum TaxID=5046 RepID=A0AA39GCB0_SARSR|nr:hypothetical protein NLU13_8761 [Sarocladium strictum]